MEYSLEELLPVAAKLAEKYTGCESTSITNEKAQQLLGAVLYCIREQEETAEGVLLPDAGRRTAMEAYELGYSGVLKKAERIRELYNSCAQEFCSYGNRCLSDTFLKGVPAFLKYYDARFNPQQDILTYDYPLLRPIGERSGADAVYYYLSCIRLEQRFLNSFDRERVKEALDSSVEDFEEMLVNLSRTVYRELLFGMLPEYEESLTHEKLREELDKLLQILLKRTGGDEELYWYLSGDLEDFAAELKNAAEHGSLNEMFRTRFSV